MSETTLYCDLCEKQIPFGSAYFCILYNIENMQRDHIEQEDYVEVVSSDQIFTMCGKCGNVHHAEATEQILKTAFSTLIPRLN